MSVSSTCHTKIAIRKDVSEYPYMASVELQNEEKLIITMLKIMKYLQCHP